MRTAPALLVLLAACAGPGPTAGPADSWHGASYDEVVRAWGAPARSTRLSDGADVHTWVSDAPQTQGRVTQSVGVGMRSGGGGSSIGIGTGVRFSGGSRGAPARCERTLIFREGRVSEQQWQGSAEVCEAFRR